MVGEGGVGWQEALVGRRAFLGEGVFVDGWAFVGLDVLICGRNFSPFYRHMKRFSYTTKDVAA